MTLPIHGLMKPSIVSCIVTCAVGVWVACSAPCRADIAAQPSSQPGADGATSPTAHPEQISEYVRKVFQDREGRYWFGTNDDGVARFDGTVLAFFGPREGLAGQAVRGMVQDRAGAVWIATDGGVSRYAQDAFTTFTFGDAAPGNDAWSILLDSTDTIWVGTRAGVFRFDGKAFVPFALPEPAAPIARALVGPGVVLDMAHDQAGNIWFATDGAGLYKYDGKNLANYTAADGLASNHALSVHADRRGRLWVGTDGGGVTQIDGAAMRTYTAKDGIGNNRIWDVAEDRQGNMWFATLGAGVARFDGSEFAVFGAQDGLTPSHVQHLFEDRDGTLWLACSGGLFRRDGQRFVNVARDGPWNAGPLAAYARLVGGQWKMTTTAGSDTFDTWHWGPGGHSIRSMRHGMLPDGNPWSVVTAYYWHPAFKEVRLLSVGSVWRGVAEGTSSFEGDVATNELALSQVGGPPGRPQGPRHLKERWTFAGADAYRDELSEKVGADYQLMVAWDRMRVDSMTPGAPAEALLPAQHHMPSEFLRPLEKLLGDGWVGEIPAGASAARPLAGARTRTAFEYVPHADMMVGRVYLTGAAGAPSHAMDIYLYHHTGTRTLRALILGSHAPDGTIVYEGDITPGDDGSSLHLDLRAHRSSGDTAIEARIDFEPPGRARVRAWSTEGTNRTVIFDHVQSQAGN